MSHEKKTKTASDVPIGKFFFNRDTCELKDADGQMVRLRKQSLDVLATLVEADGEVVEKSILVEATWGNIATTDDSLVQCIADIRRVLGHAAIETFPKRGYRLSSGASVNQKRDVGLAFQPFVAVSVATLVVAAVLWLWSANFKPDIVAPPEISSQSTLAVLPFVNLNQNEDFKYFSNGLSEDIATDLSKVPGLTVIAPASSFDFLNAEAGFQSIAEDLGVRFLVRGTVRSEGERVRINVSLIEPQDGSNIWSDRFDRKLKSVFGLQEEITRHVVDALSLTLADKTPPLRRVEPDAYFMLLQGVETLRKGSTDALEQAREFFEHAIALDPQYARAHASLALTYAREATAIGSGAETILITRGLESAVRAIQIDSELPHAYLALGALNLAIAEYDNALAAARRSVATDANFSDGYALLAEIGLFGANLDEALAAIQRAKLLHPHHTKSYDHIEGKILFQLGKTDQSVALLEASEDASEVLTLVAALGELGRARKARTVFEQSRLAKRDVRSLVESSPYRFEDRKERLLDGLKLAGIVAD